MLKNQWSKKEIEDSEYEIHHRALSEEYSFFEAVKDGNIEAVSKNLKEEAFTNPEGMGILSKNPLTNLKYHFVITVALVTRYCIDGGMGTATISRQELVRSSHRSRTQLLISTEKSFRKDLLSFQAA